MLKSKPINARRNSDLSEDTLSREKFVSAILLLGNVRGSSDKHGSSTPRGFVPGASSCCKARRPNGWRTSLIGGLIRCSSLVVRCCLYGLSRDHLLSKLGA